MSDNELKSILELDCEDRYDYFLSVVGEEKEIWILINSDKQFLKIYAEDDGFEYLPVWPSLEFATEYCKNAEGLEPKGISLPEFFEKWVPGLAKDTIEIGVLPGLDADVWVTPPSELKHDLQEELSNF